MEREGFSFESVFVLHSETWQETSPGLLYSTPSLVSVIPIPAPICNLKHCAQPVIVCEMGGGALLAFLSIHQGAKLAAKVWERCVCLCIYEEALRISGCLRLPVSPGLVFSITSPTVGGFGFGLFVNPLD